MYELTTKHMKEIMAHVEETKIFSISVETKDGKEMKLKSDVFISYNKNKITLYEM